jgi:quercetin dioxygenase-like cupin family protein
MKTLLIALALAPPCYAAMPVSAFEPVISLGEGLTGSAAGETTVHAAGGIFDVIEYTDGVLATPEQTGGQFSVATVASSAGPAGGPDLTSSPNAQAWFVLTGVFEFQVGDWVFEGGPGTFVAVDAGQVHGYVGKMRFPALAGCREVTG